MTRSRTLPFAFATILALGAGLSPALAHGNDNDGHGGPMMGGQQAPGGMMGGQGGMGQGGMMGGQGGMGQGGMMQMMQMMMRMHSQGGMMGGMMGPNAGMMGPAGYMKKALDADGDGKLTPAEVQAGLTAKLAEFDANGDGTLSIGEFEALHSAMIREIMVDRFQMLDADGDGQVTEAEIADIAKKMQHRGAMGGMMGGMGQGGMGHGNPGQGGMMQGQPGQPGQGMMNNGMTMQDSTDSDN